MRTVTLTHDQECSRFRIPHAEDWATLAEYLVPRLKPGDVVVLSGPLGAGKTTFVQALAKVFGIKKTPPSPTFALMRSYVIKKRGLVKRLLHVDAYRIESARELLALDLDEELGDNQTIILLEWPEKVSSWLVRQARVIRVAISP